MTSSHTLSLFRFILITLFLLSCSSQSVTLEPTSENPYPPPANSTGYPPPANTLPPPVISTQIILTPGETHIDLPTPFPTFTLPPTPTSPFITLPTPMPLPTLAQDASGEILFMGYEDGVGLVYHFSVDANGTRTSEITPISTSGQAILPEHRVFSSPDGSRLLLMDGWGNASIFYTNTGILESVFRTKPSPHARFFSWHPDNLQVLIRSGDGYQDEGLWLVNVDTGQHITLVSEFPSPNFISGTVSPTGQQVIYSRRKGVHFSEGTWLMGINGDNSGQLWEYAIGYASWSPDGQKIAFIGNEGLSIMNSDGSNELLLSSTVYATRGLDPVWSPDSQWIAYMVVDLGISHLDSIRDFTDDQVINGATIRVINVVTGEDHALLSSNSIGYFQPVWSPDSTQIAFVSLGSGKSEIWLVNIDGTNLHQLTTTNSPVRFPVWRK